MQLAKERVKIRVQEGGHDIESDVIERRYKRGIINLFDIYLPLVDDAFLFDNSYGQPRLITQKLVNSDIEIIDQVSFLK